MRKANKCLQKHNVFKMVTEITLNDLIQISFCKTELSDAFLQMGACVEGGAFVGASLKTKQGLGEAARGREAAVSLRKWRLLLRTRKERQSSFSGVVSLEGCISC